MPFSWWRTGWPWRRWATNQELVQMDLQIQRRQLQPQQHLHQKVNKIEDFYLILSFFARVCRKEYDSCPPRDWETEKGQNGIRLLPEMHPKSWLWFLQMEGEWNTTSIYSVILWASYLKFIHLNLNFRAWYLKIVQTHKKAGKRQCHLMQIQFVAKKTWWSGTRDICSPPGSTGSTGLSTSSPTTTTTTTTTTSAPEGY